VKQRYIYLFSIPRSSSAIEFEITMSTMRIGQDTDLSCHGPFPLFVCTVICDRNSPTYVADEQMDRRTDVMPVA